MDDAQRRSARTMRSRLAHTTPSPAEFRAALLDIPPFERDAWLDEVFLLDSVPDDGPELPRGCVPYLPCSVDTLIRMVEIAKVHDDDVFVDIGSGVGRAAALVHLLTGASAIGLEIQPALVRASSALMTRLNLSRVSSVEGDAAELAGLMPAASVFFLYCPFGKDRVERVLDELESIASTRPIRVGCVDLVLPPRRWLALVSPTSDDLVVYRSTFLDRAPHAVT